MLTMPLKTHGFSDVEMHFFVFLVSRLFRLGISNFFFFNSHLILQILIYINYYFALDKVLPAIVYLYVLPCNSLSCV